MTAPYAWQDGLWQHLTQRWVRGALPHALLLTGAAGLGKNDFARAWARRMLCSRADERGACGACKFCQLMDAGTHPDFCHLTPEEGSRNIRVDQIREMVGFVTSRARFDGYKVVLISPAEAMNVNAANALLKCLEEPGEQTLFLLVSDAPRQLLPTIRSRCQVLGFGLPEPGVAVDWLIENGVAAERAESILRVAGGSPFRAQALARSATLVRREEVFNAWRGVFDGKMTIPMAAEVLAGGASVTAAQTAIPGGLIDALQWVAQWVQEAARVALDQNAAISEESRRRDLLDLSLRLDPQRLFRIWDCTLALVAAFQRGANFNVVLAVEGWLLEITGRSGRLPGPVL